MSTVRAPYPSEMDEMADKSISALARTDSNVQFYNRGGDLVGDLIVRNPSSQFVPAIARIGSFDFPSRDVLIKDWRPAFSDNARTILTPQPTQAARFVSWSPDGNYVAFSSLTASGTGLYIFKRSGNTFTKLADPPVPPGVNCWYLQWSPDGQYFAIFDDAADKIWFYKRSGDAFSRITFNISTSGGAFVWSPDGKYFVLSLSQMPGPQIIVYRRDGETFTQVATDPNMSTYFANVATYTPDGKYLMFTQADSQVFVYEQNGDQFIRVPGFDQVPPSGARACVASPNNQYVAMTIGVSPGVYMYRKSGSSFVKLNLPGFLPNTSPTNPGVSDAAWTPDSRYIGFLLDAAPYFVCYRRDGEIFTGLDQPSALPTFYGSKLSWSPDGKYLAIASQAGADSNRFYIYQSAMGPIAGAAVPIELAP